MNAIQHRTSNDVLQAPKGATREECKPLYITRVEAEGQHLTVSYWQPSEDELKRIIEGKAIRLACVGRTFAPLLIEVDGDGWI